MSSIIKQSANWMGDTPTTKTETKKEPVITEAKKTKMIESILKKLEGSIKESSDLYEIHPTMELSTTITLLGSARANIKKLKIKTYE